MNDKIYLITAVLAIVSFYLVRIPIVKSWEIRRKKINLKKKAKLCMEK